MIGRLTFASFALALAACATMSSQSLDGFAQVGGATWSFEGGEAHASSGTAQGFLVSRESYRDFELTAEVYVGDPHNSGVFIRCADGVTINATVCYEINVYDKRADQSGRTGAVPNYFTPPLARVDAAGHWNRVRIVARGAHLKVWFNGVVTVDGDGPLTNAGPIALQWGEGDVRFRNVRVRPL